MLLLTIMLQHFWGSTSFPSSVQLATVSIRTIRSLAQSSSVIVQDGRSATAFTPHYTSFPLRPKLTGLLQEINSNAGSREYNCMCCQSSQAVSGGEWLGFGMVPLFADPLRLPAQHSAIPWADTILPCCSLKRKMLLDSVVFGKKLLGKRANIQNRLPMSSQTFMEAKRGHGLLEMWNDHEIDITRTQSSECCSKLGSSARQ